MKSADLTVETMGKSSSKGGVWEFNWHTWESKTEANAKSQIFKKMYPEMIAHLPGEGL